MPHRRLVTALAVGSTILGVIGVPAAALPVALVLDLGGQPVAYALAATIVMVTAFGVWLAVGYWRAWRGRVFAASFWWTSVAYNTVCAAVWGAAGVAGLGPWDWEAKPLLYVVLGLVWCVFAAAASGTLARATAPDA